MAGGPVAGFFLASECRLDLTLIDKNDTFFIGYSKSDVMFGHKAPEAVLLPYRNVVKPGVRFRQETITAIDPYIRRVTTDKGGYEADVLVVARGAERSHPAAARVSYRTRSAAGAVASGR